MAGLELGSTTLEFAAQKGLLPGLPSIAEAETHLQEACSHKAEVLSVVPTRKKMLVYLVGDFLY